jgi:uncharacterized membrane protein YqjE
VATPPDSPPADATGRSPDGFFPHALKLLSALLAYLRARLELAGIEGKEAAGHFAAILALAVAALIVFFIGYLFFCLAIVFLLSWAFGDGHAWIWVTLGMALLHLALAFALCFTAKSRLAEPVFTDTFNEFKKDQEWLASKTENLS